MTAGLTYAEWLAMPDRLRGDVSYKVCRRLYGSAATMLMKPRELTEREFMTMTQAELTGSSYWVAPPPQIGFGLRAMLIVAVVLLCALVVI